MHLHSAPGSHSRRALLGTSLAAFTHYALLREARAAGTVTDSRLSARAWIARQEALARGLHEGSVSHLAWHYEINRLAREVDVAELMAEAGRGRNPPPGTPFMRDPVKRTIRFVNDAGEPLHLTYAAATFTFGPDNLITPHAHEHLATAHMVVEGRVRIRTFDRLANRGDALIIRPTADHVGEVGTAAAMTTERDNIPWFTPASPHATTFDVIIDSLDPGQPDYAIYAVDPLGGTRLPDGSILANRLTFAESSARYTAAM